MLLRDFQGVGDEPVEHFPVKPRTPVGGQYALCGAMTEGQKWFCEREVVFPEKPREVTSLLHLPH